MGSGTFFGCIFFAKFFVATIFIIAGGVCVHNDNCSIDNRISIGFIGFGLGIVASSVVSIVLVILMTGLEMVTTWDVLRSMHIFLAKFLVGLVLLVVGIVYNVGDDPNEYTYGSGMIGASFGVGLGSVISFTMISMFFLRNIPH